MSSVLFDKYASIILDISIDKCLDYGIPRELIPSIKRGMRVEVPVRGKLRTGYVYAIKDHADFSKVKSIERLVSETELINDELFELALWMAKYYCAPMRDVLQIILPAIVRKDVKHKEQLFVMRAQTREQLKVQCEKIRNTNSAQADVLDVMLKVKKGILLSELLQETQGSRSPIDTLTKQGYLIVDVVRVDRSPLVNEEYFQTKPKQLNEEQAAALAKIVKSLNEGRFETHLLYGVTGSGKTEVYLQAIDFVLKQGKGAIMLVPEISLTAQTIERFRSRFEGKIAILHHRLSQGERFDEWHKIRRGEAQIVIGARSAVFSPVNNLGLIIVDEEHESSYKQSESPPCYHAREVAVMRGKLTKATVILGTATPSLESFHNAASGKYTLSSLNKRADSASIPKFSIVDMKIELTKTKGYTSFSESLLSGIKTRQEKGEQTILFLNRRGYHTTLLCQGCSKPVGCPHCDVAMTFHLSENQLACHLCGFYLNPPPKQCPSCKSETMKFRGVGTEQIQKALHAVLPDIRTMRIDADTTRHKGSHQKLLRDFGTGKADVLIGTQMIAKGLHFPEVTLVGVLNSDTSLNLPDFRASETVFQLITQVAGRAGRGNICGEVIVQTNLPENNTIRLAASQNYEKFYEEEIEVRKLFNYPPFASMVKLTFSGEEVEKVQQSAENFRSKLILALPADFDLHPVVPSGYAKIKNKFRFQLIIRGPSIYPINRAIDSIRQVIGSDKSVNILVDVNPTSTFF
ncbi:MAG: primosomal protein N' [Parachlamydiaceae bacterium]|nr:primosomal protein N' [Parachlamydiaceae bacterium]